MNHWNNFYSQGSIHTNPSKEIIKLVPRLKSEGVESVLDAGCGTGRHTEYLAQQGFDVYGIDISEQAIRVAEVSKNRRIIDYRIGSLLDLPFPENSMDFILANHSLEYASDEDVLKTVNEFNRVLKKNGIILLRVVSTKHPFYGSSSKDVYGFSHIGFCIQNGLSVHFFDEEELRYLFKNYHIKRLEHIAHKIDHKKISVPLREWVLLGYKQG